MSVNFQNLDELGDISGLDPTQNIYLSSEDAISLANIERFQEGIIRHYVSQQDSNTIEDMNFASRLSENSLSYFKAPKDLLFETSQAVRELSFDIVSHEKKSEAVAKLQSFTQDLKPQSVGVAARSVFEELYMNASIDAPKLSRASNNSKACEFHLMEDGATLAVVCTDHYGSLSIKAFFHHLYMVMSKGAGVVINLDRDRGGAGIGCHIILNHCRTLIIGVKRDSVTRVTCMIPLNTSQKQREKLKKNIHIIGDYF